MCCGEQRLHYTTRSKWYWISCVVSSWGQGNLHVTDRTNVVDLFTSIYVIFINLAPETENSKYMVDDMTYPISVAIVPELVGDRVKIKIHIRSAMKWIVLADKASDRHTHSYQKMAQTIFTLR